MFISIWFVLSPQLEQSSPSCYHFMSSTVCKIMCMTYHPHEIEQVSFCWINILFFLNSSYSCCQTNIWFDCSIYSNRSPEAGHSGQRITRKWKILSCTVSIRSGVSLVMGIANCTLSPLETKLGAVVTLHLVDVSVV